MSNRKLEFLPFPKNYITQTYEELDRMKCFVIFLTYFIYLFILSHFTHFTFRLSLSLSSVSCCGLALLFVFIFAYLCNFMYLFILILPKQNLKTPKLWANQVNKRTKAWWPCHWFLMPIFVLFFTFFSIGWRWSIGQILMEWHFIFYFEYI